MSLSFEQWIEDWKDEISQIQEFTKSELPTEAAMIQADLSRTTRDYPRAGEMLADVERHLISRRAQETLAVKASVNYADLAAPERKIIVESKVAHIAWTRDVLQVTCRALQERSYALLNQRRFEEVALRMAGHAS